MEELGQRLIAYEEARRIVLDLVPRMPTEPVSLAGARGRFLAEDIVARELVPPFDNSAMDGYAVIAADLAAARPDRPVVLSLRGALAAGEIASAPLERGTTLRIMTGAPVPEGCDAVVPHEVTSSEGSGVAFRAPARAGQNVRPAGGDMRPGDAPLARGARLGGAQIAVAATLGRSALEVARRPRVAILSPGKELVEPQETPGPGRIRNSNAYGLAAFVEAAGGIADLRGIVPDELDALRAAARAAIADGADALLTTGGVSAGDHDMVRELSRLDGRPGHVFRTSMRPGKPQVFALIDGVPLFGLPGNPAAAIVSFTVFVRPALRRMLGALPCVPPSFPVRFDTEHAYKPGRVFLLRAHAEPGDGGASWRVVSTGEQDSSFLASLSRANVIVELPADRDRAAPGDVFPAWWIEESP